MIHLKFEKQDNSKVCFVLEELDLVNKAFLLDIDYIIHDNKIILAFSNIEGFLNFFLIYFGCNHFRRY